MDRTYDVIVDGYWAMDGLMSEVRTLLNDYRDTFPGASRVLTHLNRLTEGYSAKVRVITAYGAFSGSGHGQDEFAAVSGAIDQANVSIDNWKHSRYIYDM